MSEKLDNPPAFARAAATVKVWEGGDETEVTYEPYEGMTLRDYFAAKAMQGLLAQGHFSDPLVARLAYEKADAMLKERAK